jgi:phenylacetic acid degradation operon negative regulatory protein
MTVLGEFVLPMDGPVWTGALVDALGLFGVEVKSARQVLARTGAEGWLESERVGRRVRWRLTKPGRRLLVEGAERIYGFGSGDPAWEGQWLVLLVSIPESMRELRHRLRTRLAWAGFGSPTPGVWITPRPEAEAEAKLILDELALPGPVMSFVASYGGLGREVEMVAAAWSIDDLARRYAEFIAEFSRLAPRSADDVFRAQTTLVHEWRRFPFLDPQLPASLLPARWIGARATKLFNDRHARWREAAQRRWAELAGHQGVFEGPQKGGSAT